MGIAKLELPDLTGGVYALDLETTGLQWWKDQIFGVAITALYRGEYRDFYWDVRQDPWVLEWLREEMNSGSGLWVNHNIKFDALFLLAAGVLSPGRLPRMQCTMIRAALIFEHEITYQLDDLAKKYVGRGKDEKIYEELAELFGGPATRNSQMKNLHRAPAALVGRYAKVDTRRALELWQWQETEIERQDLHRIHDLEHRLLPHVIEMERVGVRVDVDAAEQAVEIVAAEIVTKQKELNDLAGFEVNPNPSASVHKIFAPQEREDGNFSAVDGTLLYRTDGGKPKIDKDALQRMRHPAAGRILELRQLIRMRDVFLSGHVLGHHHKGRIHFTLNQTKGDSDHGTGTGRCSIDSPALQQIPKRNKRVAAVVRAVFLPDEDSLWCCADWSQFEFRWFAHFSKSPPVLRAYNDDPDADFHGLIATLTGLPRKPTEGVKGNAKQINLGLSFGMGEGKMAAEMGLPFTVERRTFDGKERDVLIAGAEAKAVFEKYHGSIPGVREFLSKASSVAKERGYILTMMGRHIRFPRGQFTHKAGGLVFQGNAADALKVKMIELCEAAPSFNFRMMMSVHDENNLSVRPGDARAVRAVKEILEDFGPNSVMPMRVPVRTSPEVAINWWEASKD